jgi:hypothetical protein
MSIAPVVRRWMIREIEDHIKPPLRKARTRILTLNKSSDAPANQWNTFIMRVRADGPNLGAQLLRACENILRKDVRSEFSQCGPLSQCRHLQIYPFIIILFLCARHTWRVKVMAGRAI